VTDVDAVASRLRFQAGVPVTELRYYPGNARRGNVQAVAESLRVNGQFRPLLVQESTGYVLGGNHTLQAGREVLGYERMDVTWIDCDDATARRILLADNKTGDASTYDDEALLALLQQDEDLNGTGWAVEEREQLERLLDHAAADPDDAEDQLPAKGDLLALADVAIAEPDHRPDHGSVWRLSGRHTLVVARVSDEHSAWTPFLTTEHVFCPYPEPYLTATTLAWARPLLLVQPNRYLAGHLLDKHAAMWPASIEQVQ
jgi:hypothetical protein